MKGFYSFITLLFLMGCGHQKPTHSQLVSQYYEAFDASGFDQLVPLIADSITIAEGQYVTTYSRGEFYEHFKWDSVFQTSYQVVDLEDQGEQVVATVTSGSVRYQFLQNDPLTCRYNISFHSDKIVRIDVLDCSNADWNVWQTEVDSLVGWVHQYHPELDGFIHDLTMNGAIHYLQAIQLYQDR